MRYEIRTTHIFDRWLKSLKNVGDRARSVNRFDHIEAGNLGDHKTVTGEPCELRFFFGPGYRVYYITQGRQLILLLNGGSKSSQKKDIESAKKIIKALEYEDDRNN